jgi:hypothetical protein
LVTLKIISFDKMLYGTGEGDFWKMATWKTKKKTRGYY